MPAMQVGGCARCAVRSAFNRSRRPSFCAARYALIAHPVGGADRQFGVIAATALGRLPARIPLGRSSLCRACSCLPAAPAGR